MIMLNCPEAMYYGEMMSLCETSCYDSEELLKSKLTSFCFGIAININRFGSRGFIVRMNELKAVLKMLPQLSSCGLFSTVN